MEPQPNNSPLVVIVGETASGKTALAIAIAKQFGGEIIAADSRTIYKSLDIGTAKPTTEEQDGVPHHMLSVVEPSQSYSAADFKQSALSIAHDIWSRGKLPIVVGGSGLYIDALLYDFDFGSQPDPIRRDRLQGLTVAQLQQELRDKGIPMPENEQNPRHLIRAIENEGVISQPRVLRPNTLVIGLVIDRDALRDKLRRRVASMIDTGFVGEVRSAAKKYGWDAPGLQAPGYKAFRPYIEGVQDLEAASAQFVQNDLKLAKRQRTWFKRNKSIHWVSKQAEAVELVTTFLNK